MEEDFIAMIGGHDLLQHTVWILQGFAMVLIPLMVFGMVLRLCGGRSSTEANECDEALMMQPVRPPASNPMGHHVARLNLLLPPGPAPTSLLETHAKLAVLRTRHQALLS